MTKELKRRVLAALKRRHRERRTQIWLAERLDIAPSHLSEILSGQRSPSLGLAARLEDETGIPARDFLAEESAVA